MNAIICQVDTHMKIPPKKVALSQSLVELWGCTSGQWVQLMIGNKSISVQIIQSRVQGEKVFLSSAVRKKIVLPFSGSTRVSFDQGKLKLGPVIGILTTGYTGDTTQPFGVRSELFKSFISAGSSEKPFIYVFTPEMINWEAQTILGWYFKQDGTGRYRWTRHTSPFPDVIYERVPNRKSEALSHVQTCINQLKNMNGCQVFNQGFFNKWSVHQWLSDQDTTQPFIPETYLHPSIDTLQKMLDKHKMIYLKPNRGSLGLGIFRISQRKENEYYCRFHHGEKNKLHRFNSLHTLIRHYFSSNPHGLKHYLVQQGIRLIKYHDRPVDFRVHMHKDKMEAWKIVAVGSKAAGPGSVTTHIRTGGSIISTEDLLSNIFKDQALQIRQDIEDTAVLIAQTLEKHVDGPIGELGMDMGVDSHGHVWLFEINSKPGRHIFYHPSLKEAGYQSAKYITDYSLKLANFT